MLKCVDLVQGAKQ